MTLSFSVLYNFMFVWSLYIPVQLVLRGRKNEEWIPAFWRRELNACQVYFVVGGREVGRGRCL